MTKEQVYEALKVPLPKEAIKQHPTKKYLSTIKTPYIIDRLNEVFGLGGWIQETKMIERAGKMVVVQSWLKIPAYNISLEAYGGNDNEDLGDAYKGAQTDALSKMASFIGIGEAVYKGLVEPVLQPVTVKPIEKELNDAIAEITGAKTLDDVKNIWLSFNKFQKNERFLKAKDTRKEELNGNM